MKTNFTQHNIIIGLGNPEFEYDLTRHNIGFDTLDALNTKKAKWIAGEHTLWCIDKFHNAILIKPTTGMNISGIAVKGALDTINKDIDHIIVVHDDMDLYPGSIKIKVGGSSGKHNGVQSIIDNIGSEFIRIKIGIGKPYRKEEGVNFVLSKFSNEERKKINRAISNATHAISWIIQDGVQRAMAEFNGKI